MEISLIVAYCEIIVLLRSFFKNEILVIRTYVGNDLFVMIVPDLSHYMFIIILLHINYIKSSHNSAQIVSEHVSLGCSELIASFLQYFPL